MSILITGATGHLGKLTIEALLRRGVPAEEIIATGRRTEALADLAERGVIVRRADYDDPASLKEALAGADRMLMVSGTDMGRRVPQHANVVQAAAEAGVGLIAYTSILRADTSTLPPAEEHRGTEALLADSGVPHVQLRNGWYIENYTSQLTTYLEHGIIGAAGEGKISAATRADYAEAAATVLTTEGHAGSAYELGGEAFTMAQLAQVITAVSGTQVTYTDLPAEQYIAALTGAGLPEPVAHVLADIDRGAATGQLEVDTTDLQALIGRAPTSLTDAVAAELAALDG
ncbi:MAG TPA: SDR family oxidoreductase [Nocardioides sp.]|nr:SDR family oxidoreductase [Nocardioides sp.]